MTPLQHWHDAVNAAAGTLNQSECPPYTTALEYSEFFSAAHHCHMYLKHEHMQHTGSFKYRGALHKILSLSEHERQKGIVTASSGNHGMACALAAQRLNISASVYVPETASGFKLAQISRLGADVVPVAGDCLAAELSAQTIANEQDKTYISPYNDAEVIAGQGTIAVELLQQLPDIDAVFVAVGGGGLISGIGSYLKAEHPHIDVIGCWPANAPAMAKCLGAGKIIDVAENDTLSDGTAGNVEPNAITFQICQKVIDKHVFIDERQIATVITQMAQHERQIVEGAAAVAIAGALKLSHDYAHKKVAVIVCGRNIAFEKLQAILTPR
ncbi:threonine/serine dehydratase [Alteromonas oceanisediminis]|uniref:threonine/serine dehydratase n=1 Tax=Alteromonas oceanisediminis TaxID=2836180 RepID=UPI001BDA5C5E|nr:threonine/serine dehydratase [Alteromonas oceanisediminis]MBT0586062.1 threonine/serine dehydratase [Alteromonas oceanisediminis]